MDSSRSPLSGRLLAWAAVVPAAFLGWFFLYPLARITWLGLAGGDRTLGEVVSSTGLGSVAAFTIGQAAASTILTLALGLPVASVFARYRFPGKRALRALITVPFVLPTVVVAAAFLALVGPRGVLGVDLEGTLAIILAAHVFYNVPVVVRVVGALWESLDRRVEEAAMLLGANRLRVFWEVTLPRLRPAIAAASALVFLFTFTSFGVILILGGLGFATIEVAIYDRAFRAFDLQGAAVLSLVQLVGVAVALAWYGRTQKAVVAQSLAPRPSPPRGARQWAWVTAILGVAIAGAVTPMLTVVLRSVRGTSGWTLDFYRALSTRDAAFAVPPAEAVTNSMTFAIAAAVLAVVIGGLAAAVVAYGRGPLSRSFDLLLMLPLGTSAVTIGFGFLVALDRPIDLRTSVILLPIAHALVAIPFVVRAAVPVMTSVRHRLREAAAMLGASPWQAFREIDLPLASRALLVGGAFAFAISLGEFGATSFIARPDRPTLPVAIARFLSRPGDLNFGQAMAMAAILMVVTAMSVALLDREGPF